MEILWKVPHANLWEFNIDLCTLYFKEKHLFIYDTLFIHKENWYP